MMTAYCVSPDIDYQLGYRLFREQSAAWEYMERVIETLWNRMLESNTAKQEHELRLWLDELSQDEFELLGGE